MFGRQERGERTRGHSGSPPCQPPKRLCSPPTTGGRAEGHQAKCGARRHGCPPPPRFSQKRPSAGAGAGPRTRGGRRRPRWDEPAGRRAGHGRGSAPGHQGAAGSLRPLRPTTQQLELQEALESRDNPLLRGPKRDRNSCTPKSPSASQTLRPEPVLGEAAGTPGRTWADGKPRGARHSLLTTPRAGVTGAR